MKNKDLFQIFPISESRFNRSFGSDSAFRSGIGSSNGKPVITKTQLYIWIGFSGEGQFIRITQFMVLVYIIYEYDIHLSLDIDEM